MPGLGRLHAPDPRDAAYPLSAAPRPRPTARTWRYWRLGEILNQGQSPMCVGFAWKQWIASAPIMERKGPSPLEIYDAAQEVDEWPGNDYQGTSVRAGAKVLQTLGLISSYHWAQSVDELADWILNGGGAVLGTDWTNDMFTPSAEGFVKPTGDVAGGHAYFCDGWSQRRGAFKFAQSWGVSWGILGRFWMAAEDVAKLLDAAGEACAAVEQRLR